VSDAQDVTVHLSAAEAWALLTRDGNSTNDDLRAAVAGKVRTALLLEGLPVPEDD
jgi:hypothetical protein